MYDVVLEVTLAGATYTALDLEETIRVLMDQAKDALKMMLQTCVQFGHREEFRGSVCAGV